MREYQIISMHESEDGIRAANILMAEGSPIKVVFSDATSGNVWSKYFTTLQQAEDSAEDFVLAK